MDYALIKKELMRDEGVAREVYIDTMGHPTCGIGFNLDAHSLPVSVTFPLSDDEINILFEITYKDVTKGLDTYLAWWRTLDEVRQRVIFNMAFNLGITKLTEFKNTLKAIHSGDYAKAAEGMRNSLWYKQVKSRAERLAKAMETGVM